MCLQVARSAALHCAVSASPFLHHHPQAIKSEIAFTDLGKAKVTNGGGEGSLMKKKEAMSQPETVSQSLPPSSLYLHTCYSTVIDNTKLRRDNSSSFFSPFCCCSSFFPSPSPPPVRAFCHCRFLPQPSLPPPRPMAVLVFGHRHHRSRPSPPSTKSHLAKP